MEQVTVYKEQAIAELKKSIGPYVEARVVDGGIMEIKIGGVTIATDSTYAKLVVRVPAPPKMVKKYRLEGVHNTLPAASFTKMFDKEADAHAYRNEADRVTNYAFDFTIIEIEESEQE